MTLIGRAVRGARAAVGRVRARAGRGAVVLLYHRVADVTRGPWDLAVAPRRFDAQMAMLAARFRVLSPDELVAGHAAGRLPRRAVAVTFDDAYADVADAALPSLARHGVPAAVFAVSGAVGGGDAFWWDDLERLVLDAGPLPPRLPFGDDVWFDVPADARASAAPRTRSVAAAERAWRGWHGTAPTPRHALYAALWRRLRPMAAHARGRALAALAAAAASPETPGAAARSCTAAELRRLADSGVVTVGAHTVTHSELASLDREAQATELAGSRAALEALIGRSVTQLAYPFGHADSITAETPGLARAAGFAAAYVNGGGAVRAADDAYRLPRVYASDWDPAALAGAVDAALGER